ncbi:MAG: FAD-binding oxidoreductase, partial [Flavobacteriales bacterium]|nr:FAD-binding oxidoreductase [Flavobacteriales bacterium]
MSKTDVLIIGDGILGISVALALTNEQQDIRITIIGENKSGVESSSSLAAGAMLGCFGEVTDLTLKSKHGRYWLDIAKQAKGLWPQWIETINQLTSKTNHLKINYGTHILLNSQSGKSDNKNFQAILSSLHAHKEPYQEVDPLQIEGLNPLDDCRPLRAVYLPEEGFVDSAVLMGALRMAAINHSDIIYKQGRVIKIDNRSNLFTAFTEDNNAFSASQIVLASGANTQNLLSSFPSLRKEVPMILSGFGCSFLLDA